MKCITGLRIFAGAIVASLAAWDAAAQNLIANGGFEAPDIPQWMAYSPGDTGLTGWAIDATPSDGVQLFDGAWAGWPSQVVQLTGGVSYAAGGGVSQTISTTPGVTYTIGLDIGTRSQPASGTLRFGATDFPFNATTVGSLEHLTWAAVATGDTTLIDITSDALVSGQELLVIDNVTAMAIPEPGVLVLFALSGAVLVIRRRLG